MENHPMVTKSLVETTKTRNSSKLSFHNWLTKHTRKNLSNVKCLAYNDERRNKKREQNSWKKGFSYVWPPKSSSLKLIPSLCPCTEMQTLSTPHVCDHVYSTLSSGGSMCPSTFSLPIDCPHHHDPIYAAHIEHARLQHRCKDISRMRQIGANDFFLANLRQAAIIQEQTRVSRLNQWFFFKRVAENWESRDQVQPMEEGFLMGENYCINVNLPAVNKSDKKRDFLCAQLPNKLQRINKLKGVCFFDKSEEKLFGFKACFNKETSLKSNKSSSFEQLNIKSFPVLEESNLNITSKRSAIFRQTSLFNRPQKRRNKKDSGSTENNSLKSRLRNSNGPFKRNAVSAEPSLNQMSVSSFQLSFQKIFPKPIS